VNFLCWFTASAGAIMPPTRIKLYIQPRASKTEVAGMHDNMIKVRIAAPAIENAANIVLVAFIGKTLGIAKSRIRIVSGFSCKRKVLEIDGMSEDSIAFKLGPEASSL
jgi:uncharacterized protein